MSTGINQSTLTNKRSSDILQWWLLPYLFFITYLTFINIQNIIDTNLNHTSQSQSITDNVIAAVALILINLGWFLLLLCTCFTRPKPNNIFRIASSIFLVIGGILYLIGTLLYLIDISFFSNCILQDYTDTFDTTSNPCYYIFYYLSVTDLIGVKAILFAIFIGLKSFSFKMKILIFTIDFFIAALFGILFFSKWYSINGDGNNNIVYLTIYQCFVAGWIAIIVISIVINIYVCSGKGKNGMSCKLACGGIFAAVIVFMGGGMIAAGSIDAHVNDLFNDIGQDMPSFEILRYGISAFFTSYGYIVIVIGKIIQVTPVLSTSVWGITMGDARKLEKEFYSEKYLRIGETV